MKCSLCGNTCRARTSAFVMGASLERKLVCSTCAGAGMLIVPATQFGSKCKCGKQATCCETCKRDKELKPDDMRKALAKKLRQVAKLTEASSEAKMNPEYHEGEAHGLQRAAAIVEKFDGRLGT